MIDKRVALEALLARMQAELDSLTTSQTAAQEGAVHEETRQEDPKDTRAIEAQYLARGLAERVEARREEVARIRHLAARAGTGTEVVEVPALVAVDADPEGERLFLIVPCAGGESLEVCGRSIRTVTPASPVGQALIGREVGDEVLLGRADRQTAATVSWIR